MTDSTSRDMYQSTRAANTVKSTHDITLQYFASGRELSTLVIKAVTMSIEDSQRHHLVQPDISQRFSNHKAYSNHSTFQLDQTSAPVQCDFRTMEALY